MESKKLLNGAKQIMVPTKDHNLSNGGDAVIDLDRGDPKMFYTFWKKVDNECSVNIKASELISYFPNPKDADFLCQMPEFIDAIHRVHRVVGNAETEGRYIIGGTGSSQLFIAALRALACTAKETTINKKHVPVVCAEPYYSFYKEVIEQERSELYQWKGDANTFQEESGPYIEVVTSPNNPDGTTRKPVLKREEGMVIHDLAYYWPHYTPITSPADYDVMLFTLSKATGHAGSRVGWAIVKDKEIAKKMHKHLFLMSIGSCQEGFFRATKIIQFVADSYEHDVDYMHVKPPKVPVLFEAEGLFDYGHRILALRWKRLRAIAQRSEVVILRDFSPEFVTSRESSLILLQDIKLMIQFMVAFALLECKTGEDAEQLTRKLKIQARNGSKFGVSVSRRYVRVSMVGDDHSFNLFVERLSSLSIME